MMDMILIYHASLDYTRAKLSSMFAAYLCMYAYMHVSEILLELMLFKYALRSCGLKFMPSLGSYTLLSVEQLIKIRRTIIITPLRMHEGS